MKTLYFTLLAAFGLLQLTVTAQDVHFSQFFEAPLYRNPALAGLVSADVRVQTIYRSQWNSLANAYKTGSVNAEYKLPVMGDDFLTIGAQVFYDKAGTTDLTTTQLLPAINYHKSLSQERNMYLSVGFMGGLVQRRIDRSKMTTNSTYETMNDGETNLQSQYSYLDGSAGISFNTQLNENPENNLVLGVAYHHFNRPKNSFLNDAKVMIQPKVVASADVKFAVGEFNNITMHNDFVQQGSNREIMSGMLVGLKMGGYSEEPDFVLKGGAFYRWGDALIPTVQLDYKPFKFSVSYDVNLSRLSTTSFGRGGYELSVTYLGFSNRDNSSVNAVLCPRF